MLKDAVFVSTSVLLLRGAVVVAGMLISSNIGLLAFSVFSFAHITASSFSSAGSLGTQNSMPRYFARLNIEPNTSNANEAYASCAFGFLGLFATFLLVIGLPREVLGLPDTLPQIYMGLLVLLMGSNLLLTAVANGLGQFRLVSSSSLAQSSVLLVSTSFAVYYESIPIVLLGYSLSILSSFCVLLVVFHRSGAIEKTWSQVDNVISSFGSVVRFSLPLFLNTGLISSGVWLCGRSVVTKTDGARLFSEVAVGIQWYGLAAVSAGIMARVVLPRITGNIIKSDIQSLRRNLLVGSLVSFLSASFILFFVWLFSDTVVGFYGMDSRTAQNTLLVFVAAAVFAAPIPVFSSALIAAGKQLHVTKIIFLWWVVLNVALIAQDVNASLNVAAAFLVAYVVYFLSGAYHGLFFFRKASQLS